MLTALRNWGLVALSYGAQYLLPILSAYYIFAEETVAIESRGYGTMFMILTGLVSTFFVFKVRSTLKNLVGSIPKIIIQTTVNALVFYGIILFLQAVRVNANEMIIWVYTVGGSTILSATLQGWLILLDQEFVVRNGLF